MKVGIVGPVQRAQVWEKHLRQLNSVKEVVIAPELSGVRGMNACLLVDDSSANLDLLSEAIRLGMHSYLISDLPTDETALRNVHALSEESDVRVQLSHWPTLSPASQWMKNQLPKPDFIQVVREHSHLTFTENRQRIRKQWVDEIAWIVKWINLGTHRIEARPAISGVEGSGIRVHLKFENGASASLFHLAAGTGERHRRVASGAGTLLDCEVTGQEVKKIEIDHFGRLNVESRNFDATRAAALSAMLFFKAVKVRGRTAYTPYDALQASIAAGKISALLEQG